MHRLIRAFANSLNALKYLLGHERAIQQECVVLLIALPLACFLARSGLEFLMLIFSLLLVLIVEILNTAIESVCNGLTRDYKEEIRIAKDAGSLAVLLAILIAFCLWGYVVISVIIS